MINTALIVYYISIFIWLFPPFRNYKTKYFYFFLVLALADPVTLFANIVFNINPARIFILAATFQFISVLQFNSSNIPVKYVKIFLVLFSLVSFIFLDVNLLWIMTALLLYLVLIIILRDFILDIKSGEQINFFFFVLSLYILSVSLKMVSYIASIDLGPVYFNLTTAFQILIGIYFTFFNINNSKKIPLVFN
jgi:hypothetical protein